jgi:hypothetical protein
VLIFVLISLDNFLRRDRSPKAVEKGFPVEDKKTLSQDQKVKKAKRPYRFPSRLASKTTTKGPAAKIKNKAPNWKTTSKFIVRERSKENGTLLAYE